MVDEKESDVGRASSRRAFESLRSSTPFHQIRLTITAERAHPVRRIYCA